jgi:hypothetical protein
LAQQQAEAKGKEREKEKEKWWEMEWEWEGEKEKEKEKEKEWETVRAPKSLSKTERIEVQVHAPIATPRLAHVRTWAPWHGQANAPRDVRSREPVSQAQQGLLPPRRHWLVTARRALRHAQTSPQLHGRRQARAQVPRWHVQLQVRVRRWRLAAARQSPAQEPAPAWPCRPRRSRR